ncbi:EAL domain-containing protein [Pseudoalteromonas sp. T1lg65]|uniref:EAL domain-containing protein n=1 Tax=Pseudoalteromonas sp. T1lg65 TaxID=2077101 RepID=UPI003F7A21A9
MSSRVISEQKSASTNSQSAFAHTISKPRFSTHLPITWLVLASLIFLATLSGYVIVSYYETRDEIMARINNQLINAAKSTNVIVGENYQQNIHSISTKEFQQKSRQLTELAQALDIEYVYTMVLDPPHVRFTASSYTKTDIQLQRITHLHDIYPEASLILKSAFHSTEPVFEVAHDKWGHFISVFIPYVLPDGSTYIAGADITVRDLNQRLNKSAIEAATNASFFLLTFLLIISCYVIYYRKSLTTDPRTGFANRIALEQELKNTSTQRLSLAIVSVKEVEDIISFYGTSVGDKVMSKVMRYFAGFLGHHRVFRLTTSKVAIITDTENGSHYLANLVQGFPITKPIYDIPYLYVNLCSGVAKGNPALLLENAFLALRQAQEHSELLCHFDIKLHHNPQQQTENLQLTRLLQQACESDRVLPYFTPRRSTIDDSDIQYFCSASIVDEQGAIIQTDELPTVIKQPRLRTLLRMRLLNLCAAQFRKTAHSWVMRLDYSDLNDAEFFEDLVQILRRYPQPQQITLEFSESDVLKHFGEMHQLINSLKAKGAQIAVAGVNSGFLTVHRILKLPIDAICLESNICSLLEDDGDLVRSIEYLAIQCRHNNLSLVVNCISSKAQADLMTRAGATRLSGPWIGKAKGHL